MEIQGLIGELDPIWVDHGHRVRAMAHRLGVHLGLESDKLNQLGISAMLHDIGKARLDASVLSKPGRLTSEEWVHVRRHPQLGFEMLDGNVHPEIALAVLSHHERFDGTGYPHRLAGKEISLTARVLAVADAYDAIVSDRPYDAAHPVTRAVTELTSGAGSQFDPVVVRAFMEVISTSTWSLPPGVRRAIAAI